MVEVEIRSLAHRSTRLEEQTSIWSVWVLVPVQLDSETPPTVDVTLPSIAVDFNGSVQGGV